MHHTYFTSGTCSRKIDFELDGDVVHGVVFEGGCNGNLKAISKLVEGTTVDYIESTLAGNTCGFKPTSCADQLARAVRKAYNEENKA
ncbi:MAG: TIGR03905 family TSCPD domain-containing protein [Clostridia bacterium]|nr:TIGR03905 family TSCPD domain-containing protein [Clostridia bacterium]